MTEAGQGDDTTSARTYWLFETGTGRCVLAEDAVGHHIENAVVRALPDAGPRFDAAVMHDTTQLIPAIDLRARKGGGGGAGGPDVLVLRHPRHVGLIIDRLLGKITLTAKQVHALSSGQSQQLPDYVSAVTFMDAKPIAVLDPNRLAAEDDMPDESQVSRRLDRRKTPREPQPMADASSRDGAPLGSPSGN